MEQTPLTTDLIADTRFCRLGLRLGPDALDVTVYDPADDAQFIHRHFPLDADNRLKALENVVYDNPLVLSLFSRVDVIVDTRLSAIIPAAIDNPFTRLQLLRKAQPEVDDTYEMITTPFDDLGAVILQAIPQAEVNFLRRTFDNPPIKASLPLLAKYYRSQMLKGNAVKAFVNLRDTSADIIVMSYDRLILANRFDFRDINDIAYYVLAATDPNNLSGASPSGSDTSGVSNSAKSGASNSEAPEILLTGDLERRNQLTPILRRFRHSVMPLIFPSALFRAGKDAVAAPFDLILTPICES